MMPLSWAPFSRNHPSTGFAGVERDGGGPSGSSAPMFVMTSVLETRSCCRFSATGPPRPRKFMSGPGASRALVMKKLPPMVAERKLSRPAASNGASPSPPRNTDSTLRSSQCSARPVTLAEFCAAQNQIADDARCGERHFTERLESVPGAAAEIDVAADDHRTRVERCIAAAVDERAVEANVAIHPDAVQANDSVHRGRAPARWN